MRATKARSISGFSLVEISVAGAIMVIVAAIAVPYVMTAVANVQLRAGANNVAGVLQATRMAAIRGNRATSAHETSANGVTILYADTSQPYGSFQPSEPNASFSGQLSLLTSTPAGLVAVSPGFTPATGDPSFNGHGVPVAVDSTTGAVVVGSAGSTGYVFYVQQTRALGPAGYAAVILTPGGRIRVQMWDSHSNTWM